MMPQATRPERDGSGRTTACAAVGRQAAELAAETESVQTIQGDTGAAVRAMGRIADVVRTMVDHQTTIASAVEARSATRRELTRSVATAANGVGAVTGTLTDVSRNAQDSAEDIERARGAARGLDASSRELNRLLGVFTV
ncbi:hypothetical protein OF117_18530 [Geodermatophilus sp. YIM 151500]|uniref:hypothetical protein n=1 Tax=Geodermatophilus sp. YIM 151500 TaxID=2984531 RepID=UPI0021E46AA3|nr:hypothetical protein [Geodermatophilus sp. YIM 151500]MCV2491348.1 hypothetical protein [Geodermatophilus sp. YIM 151500]